MSKKFNRWQILLPAFVIWFVSALFYFHQYFLRVSLSPLGMQIIQHFSITPFTLSSIAASFYYTFVIMQIFSGIIIDRYGVRTALTLASFTCAGGALLFALTTSVAALYISRGLMGAGAAFSLIGTLTVASQWFSQRTFITVNGVTVMVGVLGAYVGEGPLAGLIHHIAWREVMLAGAIICYVICILIAFTVRGRVKKSHHAHVKRAFTTVFKEYFALFLNRRFLIICLFIGLANVCIDSLAGLWLEPYLELRYHLSNDLAGQISSLQYIGFGVGSIICCSLLCWWQDKAKQIINAGMLVALLALFALIYLPMPVFVLAAVNTLIGCSLGVACLGMVLIKQLVPATIIATAFSIAELFKHLLSAIVLQALGALLTLYSNDPTGASGKATHLHISVHGYHMSFMVVLACVALGLGLSLTFTSHQAR